MAFNFLGKIPSIKDWKEFEEFVNTEMANIDYKVTYLNSEIQRLYTLLNKFKKADLILRSGYLESQPPDINYIVKARTKEEHLMSVIDTMTAVQVAQLKAPILDNIKSKRERNEWKIKRIRDLIEQYQNEMDNITKQKTLYKDILNHVFSKFNSKDFPEVQPNAKLDQIDVNSSMRVMPKNAGKFIEGSVTKYLVMSIAKEKKSITFDQVAPAFKVGSVITLSNGKNDGDKIITEILDSKTIRVKEELLDESSSTTLVALKRGP